MSRRLVLESIEPSQPQYLAKAEELSQAVNKLGKNLAKTLAVNDKLTELNRQRFADWSTEKHVTAEAHPAAFAYTGDVYNGLAAVEMTTHNLEYAQRHLRILSGLYGLVRPLDQIMPYRLEMGTKLKGRWGSNLYDFWGESLARGVEDMYPSFILNCASEEYFKVVRPHLSENLRVITPKFLHDSGNGPKSKMNFAKYTRGMMARWAIANEIHDPEAVLGFNYEGYRYLPELSKPNQPAFLAPNDFTLLGRFTTAS